MPLTFLAPAFLAALAALAVPILIHLIQRERKEVIAFPSLMFLRRIPYQSVERRRIHNWLLLALRLAAMAIRLLVLRSRHRRQLAEVSEPGSKGSFDAFGIRAAELVFEGKRAVRPRGEGLRVLELLKLTEQLVQ